MAELQPDVGVFDEKIWNPQVFGRYLETIPRTKRNELLRSGVLRPRPEWAAMFPAQSGGNYAVLPVTGRIGGDPVKLDGQTDILTTGLDTYLRGIKVAGFAKGWKEEDFTFSIVGKDFMPEIAAQTTEYWDDFDQKTLIAILKGTFSMTGPLNTPFVTSHTNDISGLTGDDAYFGPTTLNTAIQRAAGDNKGAFAMALMHSAVATHLENINLLDRLKYTDANGIQRDLDLGTVNGRLIMIDDSMPVEGEGDAAKYTTFVLGRGSIDWTTLPVKKPIEMVRDAKTRGGYDELLMRRRQIFAPIHISFTNKVVGTLSPDLSEFELGANWEVVLNSTRENTIDIKAIPIARIISKGLKGA